MNASDSVSEEEQAEPIRKTKTIELTDSEFGKY
ncbi:hypothetical protein SDC9_169344 [bioreactor metagenome]|uniref:Uncharacterized protein n=1 Tax=bioreactor metagenome TaxID=1076179 RepID=A0A645G7L7_9ZZZZ